MHLITKTDKMKLPYIKTPGVWFHSWELFFLIFGFLFMEFNSTETVLVAREILNIDLKFKAKYELKYIQFPDL